MVRFECKRIRQGREKDGKERALSTSNTTVTIYLQIFQCKDDLNGSSVKSTT